MVEIKYLNVTMKTVSKNVDSVSDFIVEPLKGSLSHPLHGNSMKGGGPKDLIVLKGLLFPILYMPA